MLPVRIDRQDGVPRPDWSEISYYVKGIHVNDCKLFGYYLAYCLYEYFDWHYIRKGRVRAEYAAVQV